MARKTSYIFYSFVQHGLKVGDLKCRVEFNNLKVGTIPSKNLGEMRVTIINIDVLL